MRQFRWAAIAAVILASTVSASAEKIRKFHLLQDDAQKPMVSKVYDLKYVMAADITPFILGAVKRYNTNSYVDRVNYAAAKKQLMIVTTPSDMMPYVDRMVEAIDRPGKKDAYGSIIAGDGIYRFSYMPNYRSSAEIATILNNLVRSADGYVFYDNATNMIYWKDSASDGNDVMRWAQTFDRPVPQAELTVTVYEVRQSVLDDIGIDYLAWKNGPGLNMFSVGMESVVTEITEQALANMDKFTSYSFGGFFFAPQFDMSFVRMLSQAGDAKVAATGSLTVTNNYNRTSTIKFSPEEQNLAKDSTDRTGIGVGSDASFEVNVINPIICFKRAGQIETVYNGDQFDVTTYSNLCGNLQLKYSVKMNTVIERNNRGSELTQKNSLQSSLTFDTDVERLLAAYDKKQKVEQVNGVPFLSDIPILKYLFSTTTTVDENVKVFVTIKARLVHPEDVFAAWSGKVVQTGDLKTGL